MTKEEAIDYLDNYRKMYAELAPERFLEALDILLSKSPLPSGIDEAAEETAKKYYCSCLEKHNETGICNGCENVKISFKAGAEWMAGQFQQEQPEADLELEIERIVKNEEKFMKFQVRHQLIAYVARHFYELGLNTRKEESK